MRDGEICGLRFSQVRAGVDDDDLGEITVNRSIWEVGSKRARTYRWGHKEPKSGKSRTILVDARVIEIGQERLGKMRDVAKMLRVPAPEDGYVFSEDLIGEGPLKPSFVSNTFRRIKTRAGIDCRLHDLRGYSITEMLANKIDVNTVADYHRHQDPALDVAPNAVPRKEAECRAVLAVGQNPFVPRHCRCTHARAVERQVTTLELT